MSRGRPLEQRRLRGGSEARVYRRREERRSDVAATVAGVKAHATEAGVEAVADVVETNATETVIEAEATNPDVDAAEAMTDAAVEDAEGTTVVDADASAAHTNVDGSELGIGHAGPHHECGQSDQELTHGNLL